MVNLMDDIFGFFRISGAYNPYGFMIGNINEGRIFPKGFPVQVNDITRKYPVSGLGGKKVYRYSSLGNQNIRFPSRTDSGSGNKLVQANGFGMISFQRNSFF
jgi:hypothetical protein